MSVARCCCGGTCRSIYNCIQAGAVTPGVQSFTTVQGVTERVVDLALNYWKLGGVVLNMGGVTVTENSVQTTSSNTCCLTITYDVSVTLPYTANLTRLPTPLALDCRCLEDGVQTDLPSFTGIMSWRGLIEYSCGLGPGGIGYAETVGWENQAVPSYDALPDVVDCEPPKITRPPATFFFGLRDLQETGPGFLSAGSCGNLTNAYFDFPLRICAPFCDSNFSATACVCANANNDVDAEINIRLGFS